MTLIGLPSEAIAADGMRLRLPRESDADRVVAACSDPLIQRFLPHLPDPYTRADALTWIGDSTAAAWDSGGAVFVIADPATDEVLGSVGIARVVPGRQQAEIGYWVAPWARGKGLATAATRTLSSWAFTHGFGRLELLTVPENVASQRVALGAGYHREGIRRGGGLDHDGARVDLVAWARLVDDPPGPTPRLVPDLPDGVLSDGVVTLRPLDERDAEQLYLLLCLPESVATSVPPVAPLRADVARQAAHAQSKWLAGERAEFAICDTTTGAFAGQLGLFTIEPRTGQGMIGYDLLPSWRGRGYATRAVRLFAGWAFRNAGLSRLIAGTAPENIASQRVLERVGFVREGYQRSRLPGVGGGRIDDVLYALLPSDVISPTRTASPQ